VWIANRSDDVWVGVKCQSKAEIAGSPRNALRCSPGIAPCGGRALLGCGGFTAYQVPANSECRKTTPGVRQWVQRSLSKGQQPRSAAKAPK
jgi:hypothetical protein